jgi:uroporphyrinogen-III synthase
MDRISLLSTKILSSKQSLLLEKYNFHFNDYNAITINNHTIEKDIFFENVIVTSQNAARILIQNSVKINNVFCVGEKTKSLFNTNKYDVKEVSENAISLANLIVKKYKTLSFVFFCGNLRRFELPELLLKKNVVFTEEIIYNTSLNICKFDTDFDAILFFSPSAVKSFIASNSLTNSIAFCIGETTANEAEKYALKTVTASQTTIDATLETLISYFKA